MSQERREGQGPQQAELGEWFEAALALVRACGRLLAARAHGVPDFRLKSCDVDLVTELDAEVEKTLIGGLAAKFPAHKFIGEESVSDGGKCELTDDPTWVIDPVDGTMNLVHGFPHSCISVGLLVKKVGMIGIVYNPILNQLFTAQKGKGAFLNDQPIHVSSVCELSKALITTETGTSRDEEKKKCVFENFHTMVSVAHGIRCLGSAALNMSMVALGGADANYEFGIHAWDIAAGEVIVTEAGGVCIDPSGGPFDIMSRRVLCASTMDLALEMSKKLYQYYPERD